MNQERLAITLCHQHIQLRTFEVNIPSMLVLICYIVNEHPELAFTPISRPYMN